MNHSPRAGQQEPARHRRRAGTPPGRRRAVFGAVAVAVMAGLAFVAGRAAVSPAAVPAARPPAKTATASPQPRTRPVRLPVGSIGAYPVAGRSLRMSRPGANGGRGLFVRVRYPVVPAAAPGGPKLARGLFPLVIFAPGYRQCTGSYGSLLHAWASAGYVVAAVTFPRTSCQVVNPDEQDLANQPADVSYVISRLLAISNRTRGVLSGLVNPVQIAVAGHSDGGDTVAAVVGNTCCLDRRVSAAIVLAGAEWPPLKGTYFSRPTPPILFVQGSADTWNFPAASIQLYRADTAGPRYYLDLPGIGHFAPYEGNGPPEPMVARATIDFLDRYVAGQRRAGAAMRRAVRTDRQAILLSGGRLPPP